MGFLIVFLGGGFGAALRHGINLGGRAAFGHSFPYGTLFINVIGSLAMGLIAEYFALKVPLPRTLAAVPDHRHSWRLHDLFAFSLEAALLYERGQLGGAAIYVSARLFWRSADCSRAWPLSARWSEMPSKIE